MEAVEGGFCSGIDREEVRLERRRRVAGLGWPVSGGVGCGRVEKEQRGPDEERMRRAISSGARVNKEEMPLARVFCFLGGFGSPELINSLQINYTIRI
jgi:hypothetical protein